MGPAHLPELSHFGLSTLQGRTREQTSCQVFSCNNPRKDIQRAAPTTAKRRIAVVRTRPRAFTHPLSISSCKDKAPGTPRGDMHRSWPMRQSSIAWI